MVLRYFTGYGSRLDSVIGFVLFYFNLCFFFTSNIFSLSQKSPAYTHTILQVLISDKAENKLEPGDTITVKSFKEKDENLYEGFRDKEVIMHEESGQDGTPHAPPKIKNKILAC